MMPVLVDDPTILLARALRISARAAGATIFVVATAETSWASATIVGVRHRIDLAVEPGAALDRWLAGLPDADLRLRGHLVADLAVTRHDDTVTLDILSIVSD